MPWDVIDMRKVFLERKAALEDRVVAKERDLRGSPSHGIHALLHVNEKRHKRAVPSIGGEAALVAVDVTTK